MNPRELESQFLLQSRCLLAIAAITALASSSPALGRGWKAALTGGSAIASITAYCTRRSYKRYANLAGVQAHHEVASYGRFLEVSSALALAGMENAFKRGQALMADEPALIPASEPLPQFDWGWLQSQPDTYPHLAIVGPTGSGKSTLAEALCAQLGGVTIAIAPHQKPGDFAGLGGRVYCGGRRFGEDGDEAGDWQTLMDGTATGVSVVSVIKALTSEMDRRYSAYERGRDCGPPVNVIWDEIVACLGECPKLAKRYLLPLLREARKVKLRVIALPQDDAVESLGIKGQGQARSNLTYIRLGATAIKYAKSLEKEMPGIVESVKSLPRPCMVGDMLATVPTYHRSPAPVGAPQPTAAPSQVDALERAFAAESAPEPATPDPDLLAAIVELSRKKGAVSAADCIRGSRKLRGRSPVEIRQLFVIASERGLGEVDGVGDGVIFQAIA